MFTRLLLALLASPCSAVSVSLVISLLPSSSTICCCLSSLDPPSILRLRGIIDGLLNNLLIIFNSVTLLPSTYILSSGAGLCPLSIDDNITPPVLSLISSQPSELRLLSLFRILCLCLIWNKYEDCSLLFSQAQKVGAGDHHPHAITSMTLLLTIHNLYLPISNSNNSTYWNIFTSSLIITALFDVQSRQPHHPLSPDQMWPAPWVSRELNKFDSTVRVPRLSNLPIFIGGITRLAESSRTSCKMLSKIVWSDLISTGRNKETSGVYIRRNQC